MAEEAYCNEWKREFLMTHGMQSCRQFTESVQAGLLKPDDVFEIQSSRRTLLMGLLSPPPPCVVPTSHSGDNEASSPFPCQQQNRPHLAKQTCCNAGCQEVHIDGAGIAGLAFAIRLAENLPMSGRTLVHVWDGRLQHMGVQRKRLLAFRSPGKVVDSGQVRREVSIYA